jgi:hypothetical protein
LIGETLDKDPEHLRTKPTIETVLERINSLSAGIDRQAGSLKTDVGTVKTDVGAVKTDCRVDQF